MTSVGYHVSEIPKGELGSFSKIREEYLEFEDALHQGCLVMGFVELSDLVGAIKAYCANFNLTLEDLDKFSDITKRAFENGHR